MSMNILFAAFNQDAIKQGSGFCNCFKGPAKGFTHSNLAKYQALVQSAIFSLELAKETADAILEGEYKKFDALVKNDGCQITATQVFNLVQDVECIEEAKQVKLQIQEKLARIVGENLKERPPDTAMNKSIGHPLVFITEQLDLGFPISANFAQLMRFRLLQVVNCNKVQEIVIPYLNKKEKRDLADTDLDKLKARFPKKGHNNLIKSWIKEVQKEESVAAKQFVQSIARRLVEANQEDPHCALIARMVGDEHAKLSCGIPCTPQSFNVEVVYSEVGRQNGLVLIKRKLTLGGVTIPGADPLKIFVRAQKDRTPLSLDEVSMLHPKEPVWVVEGFIGGSHEELVQRVHHIGVKELLMTTIAFLPQYNGGVFQTPLDDKEADKYIENKKDMNNVVLFEPEHIYTASVKEEK